jgi:5'-methylthioadenosine phosphorylase
MLKFLMIGIISGSGLYTIEGVVIKEIKSVATPFGVPSDSYRIGELSGREVVFLPRHGSKHTIPPHRINYRANIWGFKELGVKRILSISASGGITPEAGPGTIVVPDQIIDMTSGREVTFFDGEEGVFHIDLTYPYCNELRETIFSAGKVSGIELMKSGTYICTNGPRLETRAEISFFSLIGADIVGMTAMPEASLAREAGLCYSGISVVTNYAAGLQKKALIVSEVVEMMNKTAQSLYVLLKEALPLVPSDRICSCKDALNEAKM